MDLDRARKFLVSLPHVTEEEQFGGLIYWVADKALGGKMMAHLSIDGGLPAAFPAGRERYAELQELEGFRPAPYLARAFWVAAERWDVWRNAEWQAQLQASYELTRAKLPPRTLRLLEGPAAELRQALAERKRVLAGRQMKTATAIRPK